MSRSEKAPTSAREVSGDGGTGLPNGSTQCDFASAADAALSSGSRAAAARIRSAPAGTCTAPPQTPMMARPFEKVGSILAQPLRPGYGVELVAASASPGVASRS